MRDFYTEVGFGDYEAAWARLTEPVHATLGGFDTWQAGYGTSLSMRVSGIHAVEASPRAAVVMFKLRSEDIDECADPVVQRFAGRWELAKVGRHWRATAISAEKVAGRTPITSVEDCPDYGEELGDESAPDPDSAPTDGYSYSDEPDEEPDNSYEPDEDPDYGYPDDAYGPPTTEDFGGGEGSVGLCEDGTLSDSIGRQGACSDHGGVAD